MPLLFDGVSFVFSMTLEITFCISFRQACQQQVYLIGKNLAFLSPVDIDFAINALFN
jgi:hypothetical protein